MSQSSWLVTVAWRMGHSLSPTKVSTKDLWSNKKPKKKTQCLGSGKILKPTRINSYDSYFINFQYANWQQRKNINIHEYPALIEAAAAGFILSFCLRFSLLFDLSELSDLLSNDSGTEHFFGRWTNWAACHSAGILRWLRHKTWQRVCAWKFSCIAAATPNSATWATKKKTFWISIVMVVFHKDPYNGSIVIPRELCSILPWITEGTTRGSFFMTQTWWRFLPFSAEVFHKKSNCWAHDHPPCPNLLMGEGRGFWKKNL